MQLFHCFEFGGKCIVGFRLALGSSELCLRQEVTNEAAMHGVTAGGQCANPNSANLTAGGFDLPKPPKWSPGDLKKPVSWLQEACLCSRPERPVTPE